ncbi:MAG TPA: DegV family protein [Gaiellaceae bacterium]|nr:DegV family protein [Gaiellaceae bacterium]
MNLSAQNTAIVLDSTADLPDAADRFPNWRVVPLYVRFGDESLRDGVDIDVAQFYARLRSETGVFPTTSQPTPGDFLACYRELGAYERVFSLHVSARVSGTFASAEAAAADLGDGRVRAIDTETASASTAMLALAIQRRLERGTRDEEVDALVERYKRERGLLFTVDTLEFLARGGRIGKAAAFAGTLLHVKPILSIRDGEVVPVKRVRGERNAFAELAATLEGETRDEPGFRLGVAHAAAPERAGELEALVRERRPHTELELVVTLGAVIGAHAGPGTLALFWFRDDDA